MLRTGCPVHTGDNSVFVIHAALDQLEISDWGNAAIGGPLDDRRGKWSKQWEKLHEEKQ